MAWSPQARAAAAAARKAKYGSTSQGQQITKHKNPLGSGPQSSGPQAFTQGMYIHAPSMGKLAPVRHTPLEQAAFRKSGAKSGQKPVLAAIKKYPSSKVNYGRPRSGLFGKL